MSRERRPVVGMGSPTMNGRAWADDVGVHRQRLERADDGQRDDIHLGLDGGIKDSAEEGLDVAVAASSALGKDDEGHSVFYGLRGGRERTQGVARVGAVDGDLAGAPEMPAEKRKAEEFDTWQESGNGRAGRRKAPGCPGPRSDWRRRWRGGRRDAVESFNGERRRRGAQDEPRPETRRLCWMRPERSTSELSSESVPRNTV